MLSPLGIASQSTGSAPPAITLRHILNTEKFLKLERAEKKPPDSTNRFISGKACT